jgi:uncharacterized protein YecA (UPF0149 family)
MRINFTTIAQQQAQLQIIETVEKHPEFLEKLKNASQITPLQKRVDLQKSVEMIFSDEDGVEVFEVDGDKEGMPKVEKVHRKIRPNDPCPCGSGKKYKKCCGKNE